MESIVFVFPKEAFPCVQNAQIGRTKGVLSFPGKGSGSGDGAGSPSTRSSLRPSAAPASPR